MVAQRQGSMQHQRHPRGTPHRRNVFRCHAPMPQPSSHPPSTHPPTRQQALSVLGLHRRQSRRGLRPFPPRHLPPSTLPPPTLAAFTALLSECTRCGLWVPPLHLSPPLPLHLSLYLYASLPLYLPISLYLFLSNLPPRRRRHGDGATCTDLPLLLLFLVSPSYRTC